jgi:hypothetical protein
MTAPSQARPRSLHGRMDEAMTDGLQSSRRCGLASQAPSGYVGRRCGADGSPAVPGEETMKRSGTDATVRARTGQRVQHSVIDRRSVEMDDDEPERRERQPWNAASKFDGQLFAGGMGRWPSMGATRRRLV